MEPHGVFKEVTKQCTNKDHNYLVQVSPCRVLLLVMFEQSQMSLPSRDTKHVVCMTVSQSVVGVDGARQSSSCDATYMHSGVPSHEACTAPRLLGAHPDTIQTS
jgi:hypothetical protein